jgi:hypothetical protein
VLKGTFGRKREEVTGGFKKLHNGDLPNLYCATNIKSRRRWVEYVARMEEDGCVEVFVGSLKEAVSRRRREDNIEINLRELHWGWENGLD